MSKNDMTIEQLMFNKWIVHDLIQKSPCNWHEIKWVEKREAINHYINIQ